VVGPTLFDVVIEDANHDLASQLAIYKNFRSHLAPGGIYIIEDVENIDRDIETFRNIDPERRVQIIDLRSCKGRYDDVLVVIGGKE
jgi:spermidine synthase